MFAEEHPQRCAGEEEAVLPIGVRKDGSNGQLPVRANAHETEGRVTSANGDDKAVVIDRYRRHMPVRSVHLDRMSARTVQCPQAFRSAGQESFTERGAGEHWDVIDVTWCFARLDPKQPITAGDPAAVRGRPDSARDPDGPGQHVLVDSTVGVDAHCQRQGAVDHPQQPTGGRDVTGNNARTCRQIRDGVEIEVDQRSDIGIGLVTIVFEQPIAVEESWCGVDIPQLPVPRNHVPRTHGSRPATESLADDPDPGDATADTSSGVVTHDSVEASRELNPANQRPKATRRRGPAIPAQQP
ncbi:hypothetical protein [Rhodococcus sp. (in: high G+C Gram-positive bacteria)]|uniref:hypothetical protein n=1 Tax=Rhodococcus sp. TaxID=1831 RepID=UPI003B8A7E81